MKKLISIIISLNLIILAKPAYPGGRDFLAVPGYAEQERQIEEFLEKHGEDNPIILEKDGVTHIIFGVNHEINYPEALIDRFILKDDIVTSEGFISAKFLIINNIFKLFGKLISLIIRQSTNQSKHEKKLINRNVKLLNLDIVYTKSGSLIKWAMLFIIFVISLGIYLFMTGLSILTLIKWQVYFMGFSFFGLLFSFGLEIDTGFRNLNFAEKLAYLKNILNKNTRIITINGKGHKEDTVRLLLSDSLREKEWNRYARNFWMKFALRRKTDIVESMDIRELLPGEDWEVIGTIADLPGPRNLIAAIEKSH